MMIGLYLLLNLAVLWITARAASATGWRLVLMLFAAGWIVGSLNSLIEAIFFGVLRLADIGVAALFAAIVFAFLSPVAVLLAGRWRSAPAREEEAGFTLVGLVAIVVAYEILYWTAGTLVFPYVGHFYTRIGLPPVYAVAGFQIVRSLIFVAALYPLLRSGLRGGPIVLALFYSIIGGVAPLLPDNPYMPADIRFYHGVEVTVSNFIFGLVVGLLSRWRPAAARPAQA